MIRQLLVAICLLWPDSAGNRPLPPAAKFVPPPIETQVEYFSSDNEALPWDPPRNRRRFAIEFVFVVTTQPVAGATADEMLARIEEMRKTTGLSRMTKARLVSHEDVRCRERRGFEACADSKGRILTRSFIESARRDDPPHLREQWKFIGDTFEARPYFDEKNRLCVDFMCEHKELDGRTIPVASIHYGDGEDRWDLNYDITATRSSLSIKGDEFIWLGGGITSGYEIMPDGRRVETHKENLIFVKVHPLGPDEK